MTGWKLKGGGGAVVPSPLEEGDVLTATVVGGVLQWIVLSPIGPANVGVLQIVGTGSPAQWGTVTPGFMNSNSSPTGALLTSQGGANAPLYLQIIKAGTVLITGNGTTGPYTVTFTVAFPSIIQSVTVTPNQSGTNTSPPPPILSAVGVASFKVSFGGTLIGAGQTVGLNFIAIGT